MWWRARSGRLLITVGVVLLAGTLVTLTATGVAPPGSAAGQSGSPTGSSGTPTGSSTPSTGPSGTPSGTAGTSPSAGPSAGPTTQPCVTGAKLVPRCGVLWGAAAAAHTDVPLAPAVHRFEQRTGRTQTIFHTYHRGIRRTFPTDNEIALASDPQHPRIPFINWKPSVASWADIAHGDPRVDGFIDRLAEHLKTDFPRPFFLTIHHEPENDVRAWHGSGYTAEDYAAMYRHVVQRLRADGADNVVTVMTYMGYVKWCLRPWHDDLYPGDDVVDWVAWDVYAYSTPGYGYGDFAEMLNRGGTDERLSGGPVLAVLASLAGWPGFYNWASSQFPDKPLMLGEWGVWSGTDRGHKAWFYRNVADEIARFPRLKAMVYFDSPDAEGRDSRPGHPHSALADYRTLGDLPLFHVEPAGSTPTATPTPG